MCHKIGLSPILIRGFGLSAVSSLIRVPNPPAKITALILSPEKVQYLYKYDLSFHQ